MIKRKESNFRKSKRGDIVKEALYTWRDMVDMIDRLHKENPSFYYSSDLPAFLASAVVGVDGIWVPLLWFRGKNRYVVGDDPFKYPLSDS